MKVMTTQSQASINSHSKTPIATPQVSNHQQIVDLKLHRSKIHHNFKVSKQLQKLKSGDHNLNKISNR